MPNAACFLVFRERRGSGQGVGKAENGGVRENARIVPALTLNPVVMLSQQSDEFSLLSLFWLATRDKRQISTHKKTLGTVRVLQFAADTQTSNQSTIAFDVFFA